VLGTLLVLVSVVVITTTPKKTVETIIPKLDVLQPSEGSRADSSQ
jgi:hypothetical protein